MTFYKMLSGGDRRSIGKSDAVVKIVLKEPGRCGELMEAILDADPLVRMRAADAAEKVTARVPALAQPYLKFLLSDVATIPQQEVRWHVCQMVPRLKLTVGERRRAFRIFKGYLDDKSGIVRTFAMQALYDLALQDTTLWGETRTLLEELIKSGTPAMRARGKKLVAAVEKRDGVE